MYKWMCYWQATLQQGGYWFLYMVTDRRLVTDLLLGYIPGIEAVTSVSSDMTWSLSQLQDISGIKLNVITKTFNQHGGDLLTEQKHHVMLCCVMYGSSGHIHRCSTLLFSMSHSVQQPSGAVWCWLTVTLMHQEYHSVLGMWFFTLNLYIRNSDIKSPLSKSSTLTSSLRAFTMLARSTGWPSSIRARSASLSALSLARTPAWPGMKKVMLWIFDLFKDSSYCLRTETEPFRSYLLSDSAHIYGRNPVISAT